MTQPCSENEIALRPTTAHVDLEALAANVRAVKRRVGSARVMGVVKANAYGHGLLPTAQALLRIGVDALGVAFLEEGVALRRAGVKAPILVLGGIIGNQIVSFLEYDLELTASSVHKLTQIEAVAQACGRRAKVHLKIDTGMERIGMHWDTAAALFSAAIKTAHCDIVGVFSHLAAAESDDRHDTMLQLERFEQALTFFPRHGVPMPCRHIANSGAILQHPASFYDMVRPGLMLYGVYPSAEVVRSVPLVPVLSLKTRVVYFKVVRARSPISYRGTYAPPRDTRVVTLPIGYADGYARAMSNRAQVLLGGKRFPVVGLITMDAMMVEIGDDSAYNGDPVVLLGSQGAEAITVEELAAWSGTIPYEVLTAISVRVPRTYGGPLTQHDAA